MWLTSWHGSGQREAGHARDRYKSQEFLDLRRWYTDTGGELKPSPRGIRFNSELVEPLAHLLARIADGTLEGAA